MQIRAAIDLREDSRIKHMEPKYRLSKFKSRYHNWEEEKDQTSEDSKSSNYKSQLKSENSNKYLNRMDII